jgi:acetyl esterase/lipase
MAGAADCRVLLLDYRLAPEHPFPAAVDDAVAAYRYLLEESARPGRVVIAGDSAGGGLALATLVSASRPGPIWRPPVIPIAPGQWTIRWFGSMGCGKWRGYMPRTTCAICWHHR